MFKKTFEIFLAISLVLTGIPALPRAWPAIQLMSAGNDTVAIAEYHLASYEAQDFEATATHALDQADGAQDVELAVALKELAKSRNLAFSAELNFRIDEAIRSKPSIPVGEAWDGFLTGKAPTEAALAGAIAADLIGLGDIRDLGEQWAKYYRGEEVDKLVVMFAAVGVILTAGTILIPGLPAMEKAGVSTLKVARKMKKIPDSLSKEILELAGQAIDWEAFGKIGRAIWRWPLNRDAIIVAAKSLIRQPELQKIKAMGDDVITLGQTTGYQGALDALSVSDSAFDLNRRVTLAEAYGTRSRAVFKMLAKSTLSFADLVWTVFAWAAGAAIWAIAAASLLLRWSTRLVRFMRRR